MHINRYKFYWKKIVVTFCFLKIKSLTCRPFVCKLSVWCLRKLTTVRDKVKHYIPSQHFHTNRTDWTVCRSWSYPDSIRTPWWPSPGTWPLGVGVLAPGTPGQACWDDHILHDPKRSTVYCKNQSPNEGILYRYQ